MRRTPPYIDPHLGMDGQDQFDLMATIYLLEISILFYKGLEECTRF